jgi:hypothetical protein
MENLNQCNRMLKFNIMERLFTKRALKKIFRLKREVKYRKG